MNDALFSKACQSEDDTVSCAVIREVAVVGQAVKALHQRLDRVETTQAKQQVDTAGILEVWQAAVGGLKVLGWLGAAAKWLVGIAAAIAAVYAGWKWGQS